MARNDLIFYLSLAKSNEKSVEIETVPNARAHEWLSFLRAADNNGNIKSASAAGASGENLGFAHKNALKMLLFSI